MPRGPKGEKRPADVIGAAVRGNFKLRPYQISGVEFTNGDAPGARLRKS
jgi:hypothetical protein